MTLQSYPTTNLPSLSSRILPQVSHDFPVISYHKPPMTFQSGVPCSHFRGHCWAMLVVGILPWNQTEHLWTGSEQSESWNTLIFGQTTYFTEEAIKPQILLWNNSDWYGFSLPKWDGHGLKQLLFSRQTCLKTGALAWLARRQQFWSNNHFYHPFNLISVDSTSEFWI